MATDPEVRAVVRAGVVRARVVPAAAIGAWRAACFLALARAFWRRCRRRFRAFFDAVIGHPSGQVRRSGSP